MTTKLILATLCMCSFYACTEFSKEETPRKGSKTLVADESFKPLMETASYTFMGINPKAELTFNYTSETQAMNALSSGKTHTIFVSRDFTEEEKKKLKTNLIQVKSEIIAHDAVVFIVNNSNIDTLLTQKQIEQILTGELTEWPNNKQKIEVVFDRVQSANFNYMLRFLNGKPFGPQVHAAKSMDEVINYVSKNPLTLGVIGYNFISDLDDKAVQERLKQFKTVGIGDANNNYWRADKACITEKKYPFVRPIWYINSGAPDGLNSGFVNFLTSRQGQLLLEKCELGPGRGTPREITIMYE